MRRLLPRLSQGTLPHRGPKYPHSGSGLLAGAIAIAVAFSAPAIAAETAPKHGGTLEFAVTVEPENYDCHGNTSFAFLHPVAPHYSTLLKFDTLNYPQIIGDLAKSWTVSNDRLTYTFKLWPNVLFHDGSKFTAADVKASYERIAHPPPGVLSSRQVDFAAIEKIEIPEPYTVVFRLQWPEAAMLANFASPWNCIYSSRRLAEDPNFPKSNVLGTGPFRFVEHVKKAILARTSMGKLLPAGQTLSGRLPSRFHAGATCLAGSSERPGHGGIPRGNARSTRPAGGGAG